MPAVAKRKCERRRKPHQRREGHVVSAQAVVESLSRHADDSAGTLRILLAIGLPAFESLWPLALTRSATRQMCTAASTT